MMELQQFQFLNDVPNGEGIIITKTETCTREVLRTEEEMVQRNRFQ